MTSNSSLEERTLLDLAGVDNLRKVKTLCLSNRNLKNLDVDLINQLVELEELDISGNKLNQLQKNVNLPKLRKLNISDNMFSDLSFLEHFSSLEELTLEGNPISFSDRYIAVCLLPSLKKIDGNEVNLKEIIEGHEDKLRTQIESIWDKEFLSKCKTDLSNDEWLKMENKFLSRVKQSNVHSHRLLEKFKFLKTEQIVSELLESVREGRYKNQSKKLASRKADQSPAASGTIKTRKRKLKESSPLPEVSKYELEHLLRCHSSQGDPNDSKTQVWKCAFEPDCMQEGKTTSIVATCGGCIVSLIDCSTGILMKRYKHSQVNEEFYCLAWTTLALTSSSTGTFRTNILAVAGKLKSILLIHPSQLTCYKDFIAHSHPVNALLFHPKHPTWLFSGSSDRYVHCWDIGVPHLPDYKVSPNKLLSIKADFGFLHLGLVKKNEYLLTTTEKKCLCWQLDEKKINKKVNLTCIEFIHPDTTANYVLDGMAILSEDLIASRCSGQNHIYIWSFSQTMKQKGLKKEMQCITKLDWKDTDGVYIGLASYYNSGLILSGDDEGSIWLYNVCDLLKDKQIYKNVEGLGNSSVLRAFCAEDPSVNEAIINAVCMSSSLEFIVGVADNNLIHIWRSVLDVHLQD